MARKREGYNEELMRITGQYVEEVEAGRHPRLSDYISRYPHYAEAIIDFVAYYHTFEIQLPRIEDEKGEILHIQNASLSPLTQTSLYTARKRVYAHAQQQPSQAITTLFKEGEDEQLQLERLTHHLHLSKDMVILLEHRRLNASTIPLALQRRLAVWLQQPISIVQYFLLIAVREDHWLPDESGIRVAEQPLPYPEAPKKHFLQALEESTEATEEQRAFWRVCVECEQRGMK